MPTNHTLTQTDLATFAERGIVELPDAFPAEAALAMQAEIWRELRQRNDIERDDPSTWHRPWHGLKRIASRPVFRPILSDRVRGALDDLLGVGRWRPPTGWNMFRVDPPLAESTPWSVPAAGWHWDAPPDSGMML